MLTRATLFASAGALAASVAVADAQTQRYGIVGIILPTRTNSYLRDFPLFMPPGVAMMPDYVDVQEGSLAAYQAALPVYGKAVEFLAGQGCRLVIAGGAPPFMVAGYAREQQLVADWARENRIMVISSARTSVDAMRALGIQKLICVTPLTTSQAPLWNKYLTEAGLNVLGIESLNVPFNKIHEATSAQITDLITTAFERHPGADGIYILGSEWSSFDLVETLEKKLGVPIVNPLIAQAWSAQKHLRANFAVPGYGRLIAQLP